MGESALSLARAKLATSGLAWERVAPLAKLQALNAADVAKLFVSYQPRPGLLFPYLDAPHGGAPCLIHPHGEPFHRIRYLAEPPPSFGESKKNLRYVQPPESGVRAYFPMTWGTWPETIRDPKQSILITEGELKALAASDRGFPTIGLGGVYSWRCGKGGYLILPELEEINWVARTVHIVFDSDLRDNPNVAQALNGLAERLMKMGALPRVVFLPNVMESGKTGLDDLLVKRGTEALSQLLEASQPLTLSQALWSLNNKVLYVRDPGLIVDQESGQKYAPRQFTEHAFSQVEYPEQTLGPNGQVSLRAVPAAPEWLKWPLRHEVRRLTFAPGQPRIIREPIRMFNTWSNWGVEPKKGSVRPFLTLVTHLFPDQNDNREWFLKWLAYPLRYPGTKLYTSCLFHSIRHGVGKSLLGYSMGRIYGPNFGEITQRDLHGSFNDWLLGKQFILGDDVTGSDKRADADLLKQMITRHTVRINEKFIPSYELPDVVNFFWTSNQPDAFFLEDDDRRFFIHEVKNAPLSAEFYRMYNDWYKGDGAAHLFHYLLNLDLAGFNPADRAPLTPSKLRMMEDARSDLGAWVRRLHRDPDSILRVGQVAIPGDLFTSRRLLEFYDPEGRTRVSAQGLGRELRRAGIPLAAMGVPIKVYEGQERYYAVRNGVQWQLSSTTHARAHVMDPSVRAPRILRPGKGKA